MPKKKTTYESKGFVRRIAGNIFSSRGSEDAPSGIAPSGMMTSGGDNTKWRPRKKQFERLDGDEDEDEDIGSFSPDHYQNWTIKKVYSTESDAGEYKREILYEKKQAAMHHRVQNGSKKRDLTAFGIKPPSKDTQSIRPTLTNSASKKKIKTSTDNSNSHLRGHEGLGESNDSSFDAFGFHTQNSFVSFQQDDESTSRHTMSSRQTSSTKHSFLHPSHHTISSDPTDFFSKEAVTLTENNLARMAAMSTTTKDTLNNGSIGRYPAKGKFYQFAVDEDRESTVVESNIGHPLGFGIPEGDEEESMRSYDDEVYTDEEGNDDGSDCSAGVGSQKTKVQERNDRPVINPPKKNEIFFRDSERSNRLAISKSEEVNAFATHKEDPIEESFAFPDDAASNIADSVSNDPFLEPPQTTALPSFRQASAHSLSYSPSPTNRKKTAQAKAIERLVRDERLPLSPLGNMKATGSSTSTLNLPPIRPSTQKYQKKPDPDSEWTPFEDHAIVSKPDPDTEFSVFGPSENIQSNPVIRKKRDPSLTSAFPEFNPNFPEEGSTKENRIVSKNDQRRQRMFAQKEESGLSKQSMISQRGMAFSSESEIDDDEDSFGSDGLWERSGGRVGLNKFSATASIGDSVTSYESKRIDVDDNRSTTSYGNLSAAGGAQSRPLGLPSNAIMASMLFRTHYNIDQQDVDEKIKAKEEENTKNRKARNGDIPAAVQADYDYMTNVSSFSEDTSHFQDTWRKPSRDLLDYFSRARTMQVDTRERLENQRARAKAALFEA